jgi:hypothetical protein
MHRQAIWLFPYAWAVLADEAHDCLKAAFAVRAPFLPGRACSFDLREKIDFIGSSSRQNR